jgi:hypothetical protein
MLIPWCRVFLEKVVVIQLIKKFPTFVELKGSTPCPQNPTI